MAEDPEGIEFKEEEYIPISRRPEWQDVTPVRDPPLPASVVAIDADPAHQDLLAFFWAGVDADERSQRMLDLTEEIILEFNSAHYTVWEWRWRCVQALGGIGEGASPGGEARTAVEVALMRRVAAESSKNYQLWNYRRKFALARGPAHWQEESEFSKACLAVDAKNYHAWAHRQAVALAFGGTLWTEELKLTEVLLEDDVRNNSAWNQRMFILENAPSGGGDGEVLGPEVSYDGEVDYVVRKLELAPHNEAAWAYLNGLTRSSKAPPAALAADARIKAACCAALQADPSNAPATLMLAECCLAQVELLRSVGETEDGAAHCAEVVGMVRCAKALFERAAVADPARAAYYRLRVAQSL